MRDSCTLKAQFHAIGQLNFAASKSQETQYSRRNSTIGRFFANLEETVPITPRPRRHRYRRQWHRSVHGFPIEEAIKHSRKAPALHSPLRARTSGDEGDQVADLSEKSTRVPSGSNLKGLDGGAPVVPLTSSQVEEM